MKDYFKFNLTGKKLLPIWLLFMVFFVIPYGFVQYKIQGQSAMHHQEAMQRVSSMLLLYGEIFILLIIEYVFIFYIAKMSIENIEFKDKSFVFNGKFGEFFGILILGFFLTIITLGIYSPWFMKKMYNFFALNSSHDSNNLEFKGEGKNLFIILTIFIVVFIILLAVYMISLFGSLGKTSFPILSILSMCLMSVLILPYVYYIYKWIVDFRFKNYSIKWETQFWDSMGKLAIEILLTIITLGIYSPLASLKLYKYFAERTVAVSDDSKKKFGYDIEPKEDFLFIWGQVLLTIVTLGVYYSWAYCKVMDRVLGKTYTEKIEVAE